MSWEQQVEPISNVRFLDNSIYPHTPGAISGMIISS